MAINTITNKTAIDSLAAGDFLAVDDLSASGTTKKCTPTQMTAFTEANFVANRYVVPSYKTTRSYIVGAIGVNTSGTNTNTLTTDTMYGVLGFISSTVTITTLSFRTSSSNVSVDAAVKFAIYSVNADGTPNARLGMTTTGVTVTDLAVSTVFTGTLDSAVQLTAGTYLFCILPTTATTAVRAMIYTSTAAWTAITGATSIANAFNVLPVVGYTGAATYSTGFPNPFGTPTAITSITNTPVLVFTVQ